MVNLLKNIYGFENISFTQYDAITNQNYWRIWSLLLFWINIYIINITRISIYKYKSNFKQAVNYSLISWVIDISRNTIVVSLYYSTPIVKL